MATQSERNVHGLRWHDEVPQRGRAPAVLDGQGQHDRDEARRLLLLVFADRNEPVGAQSQCPSEVSTMPRHSSFVMSLTAAATLLLATRPADAGSIRLQGLLGTGVTAVVSNY